MFLSTVADIWNKAWPILLAILFFGFIVMSHELGHFLFAKLFKVRVNEFSMGMGPKLFQFGKKETRYSLRLLPIGGFVSMEGEDEDSDDARAFCNKPVWQRFIVVLAGATVNLLFGLLIIAIMLSTESLIATPQIHSFQKEAVSVSSGLQVKDQIYSINGKRVYSTVDLSFLMSRDEDGVMDFVVKRDGKKVDLKDVTFQTKKDEDGNNVILYDFIVVGVKPDFLSVTKNSFLQAVSIGRMVYQSLLDMVTGHFRISDVSGAIGVVNVIADTAQQTAAGAYDISSLLMIFSLIAINIGIFNLLPVPALDGGRLFFMLIEIIFRKPVPQKYEKWVHAIGLVILMLIMVLVSFNDILKWIRG